jgi:hypothetical protein
MRTQTDGQTDRHDEANRLFFRHFATRSVSDVDRRDCRAVCANTFEMETDLPSLLSARCIEFFFLCTLLSVFLLYTNVKSKYKHDIDFVTCHYSVYRLWRCAPLISNLCTRLRYYKHYAPVALLRGRSPQYPSNRGPVGSQSRSGLLEKCNVSCPYRDLNSVLTIPEFSQYIYRVRN